MHTCINAGQSVVDGRLSVIAGCMLDVDAGQSSVDARMQAACGLHVDCKIRLV